MASSKGQRLLSVFKALEAHPLIGISNKEIAEGLGIRQLANRTQWLKGGAAVGGKRGTSVQRLRGTAPGIG